MKVKGMVNKYVYSIDEMIQRAWILGNEFRFFHAIVSRIQRIQNTYGSLKEVDKIKD